MASIEFTPGFSVPRKEKFWPPYETPFMPFAAVNGMKEVSWDRGIFDTDKPLDRFVNIEWAYFL